MVTGMWEEKMKSQTMSIENVKKERDCREKEDKSCVISIPHKKTESSHIYYNDVIIAHSTQGIMVW